MLPEKQNNVLLPKKEANKEAIILRPRQEQTVAICLKELLSGKNALIIAPTGYGKSIVLASIVSQFLGKNNVIKKAIIIQHRKELVAQNRAKFEIINNKQHAISVVNATNKDYQGHCIFAMIRY